MHAYQEIFSNIKFFFSKSHAYTHAQNVMFSNENGFVTGFVTEFVTEFVTGIKSL